MGRDLSIPLNLIKNKTQTAVIICHIELVHFDYNNNLLVFPYIDGIT